MKRKMQMILKKQYAIYLLYTIIFIFISFIILLPFFLRGNGLIALTDSYNQAFPAFVYLKDYIYHLLIHDPIQFDFRIGLGDDVIYSLSYMGILDVTSVLSMALEPIVGMEYAFYFSIFLKLYISGIGFILFSGKYTKNQLFILSGALLYTFQVFTLVDGLDFPPYLLMRVTLPFILRGVDDVCETQKISKYFVLGLFFQGLMGFYCLYIEVMVVGIYYIFITLLRYRNDRAKFLKRTGRMLLNGICGIGLSGIVFIPSLYSIMDSSRSIEIINSFEIFYSLDRLLNMVGNVCVPNIYVSSVSLSVLGICGLVVGLCSCRIRSDIKYIAVTLWVLSFSPIMGSLMNGFSYSSLRWYFAVGLFVSVLVTMVLEKEKNLSIKERIIYYVIVICSLGIHVYCGEKTAGMAVRIAVYVVLAILLPWIWNNKRKNKYIPIYTIGLVSITGLFVFGPKVLGGCGYSANFNKVGVYNEINGKKSEIHNDELNEFQRFDIYDSSLNASLIGNYFGTSEYTSMINKYTAEFYADMLISPGVRDALHILRGLDGRQEILSLLSVSQYMDFETNDDNERTSFIKENEYYLPLGFTYNSYISRETFEQLTPLEKSSEIVNSLVLETSKEDENIIALRSYNNEYISFQLIKMDENKIRVYFPYEKYLQVLEKGQGEIYVQIRDLHGNADVYVGNKDIRIKDETYLYRTGIEEYWFNLTEIKQDVRGYYFDINIDGETDFEETKLSIYWHPINYTAIMERQKHVMKDVQIDNNTITGTINCSNDQYLFISVPFSSGWTAYVDGEKTDVLRANIGFMAIPLKSGEHNIELKYVTPGIRVGSFCSIISLAAIAIIYILNKKKGINMLK